jgi:hypothetical protein
MENTPEKKTGKRPPANKDSTSSRSSRARASKPRAGTSKSDSSAKGSGGAAKPTKSTSKSTAGAKSGSSPLTQIQISVADDYISRFEDVVGRVKKLGFKMEQELPDIGIMVGQMPTERVGELGQVEGVGYFERPRSYQLPPPENDVQ